MNYSLESNPEHRPFVGSGVFRKENLQQGSTLDNTFNQMLKSESFCLLPSTLCNLWMGSTLKRAIALILW